MPPSYRIGLVGVSRGRYAHLIAEPSRVDGAGNAVQSDKRVCKLESLSGKGDSISRKMTVNCEVRLKLAKCVASDADRSSSERRHDIKKL